MRIKLIVTTLLLLASVGVAQKPAADAWEPLRYLVGGWEGKILGPDEFTEVFEIAEAGKDFELYSEGHFKRKK